MALDHLLFLNPETKEYDLLPLLTQDRVTLLSNNIQVMKECGGVLYIEYLDDIEIPKKYLEQGWTKNSNLYYSTVLLHNREFPDKYLTWMCP